MSRHERTCEQCSITYHSPRSSSHFCSTRCRMRHSRGSPKADLTLRAWLLKRGLAGKIDDKRLGLTAPADFILRELNGAVAAIRNRGLNSRIPLHSEETFKAALRSLKIAL